MSLRPVAASAAILGIGYAVSGLLYFSLLNVPESNVLALALSAALAILIVVSAGLATALAAAVPHASLRVALRRAVAALPIFLVGMVLFAIVFAVVGRVEAAWQRHSGELDAVLLRYIGTRRPTAVHAAIEWVLWLIRWVVGLSLVIAPVVAAVSGVTRRGARLVFAIVPMAIFALVAIAISQGLWRAAYWRPRLPPTMVEVLFTSGKLLVIYATAMLLGAIVLQAYRRALRLPA